MQSRLLDTFMHDHYCVSKILENNLFNTWKTFFKWLKSAACLAGNGSKTSMAFSSHPKLLACDVTCLTIARHITDSWQNERKLRYMPMIDLVQFSNSISQRSWHFLCNVCYTPNKVLLNVRHGFILGGCSSSVYIICATFIEKLYSELLLMQTLWESRLQ